MGHGSKQSSQKMKPKWLRNTLKSVQHSYQSGKHKTTLGVVLTPVRMAKINKANDSRCREKGTTYSRLVIMQLGTVTMEINQCGGSSKAENRFTTRLSYTALGDTPYYRDTCSSISIDSVY